MNPAPEKIYLSDEHAAILAKYCKGCRYFKPDANVRDICSIIGWYIDVVHGRFKFETIVEYVKNCPCNKKCLVKPSCIEEQCPMWMNYVTGLIDKRLNNLQRMLRKKK
jgi:hypothetical protein